MAAVAETPNLDFLSDDAIDEAFTAIATARIARKTCPACKKELPLVPAAFRVEPASPDGYSKKCVICDIEEQQNLIDTCIAEANQSVEIGLQRRAIQMASRADDDGGTPHIKVIYQRLMEVFGGATGFAGATAATFLAAPRGSQQRVKILAETNKVGAKVTELGSADLNVETMTEDELKAQKAKIEERLRKQIETTATQVQRAG